MKRLGTNNGKLGLHGWNDYVLFVVMMGDN
jgi:hypothetical protein